MEWLRGILRRLFGLSLATTLAPLPAFEYWTSKHGAPFMTPVVDGALHFQVWRDRVKHDKEAVQEALEEAKIAFTPKGNVSAPRVGGIEVAAVIKGVPVTFRWACLIDIAASGALHIRANSGCLESLAWINGRWCLLEQHTWSMPPRWQVAEKIEAHKISGVSCLVEMDYVAA